MCVERPSTERIFSAAADIADPAERAAYLDEACATDPALRIEIEDLLRRDSEHDDFLRSYSPELPVSAAVQQLLNEGPGTAIGRYSLIELLGEGGFGDVYVAEQQEPVRRQVALKVIKLGMDTKQVVARFEAERQALALLDHPNIAKVYDAGTTETGRPYFVMELCQGASITKYSDDNRLTTRERLALVIDVCHAVHHAHETGIIHRDIKPTNVLVVCYDDRPVPKLIDFGIAKAIQQRLTEETFPTRAGQFVGTPQYISPEQAGMTDHGVDMRTDIYSLGVLLYELLTGTTPFEPDQLHHAGYDEICRSIRDIDPPRPSKRVSTLAFATTDVFAHRQSEPTELRRQLRGDLDSIVMKALEKDPRDRYSSAEHLADDLLRHLQNRPIRAKQASLSNRISKWSRRNESVMWSAAAILVVTLIALAGTMVLTSRALKRESVQRQVAQESERRARQSELKAREVVDAMVSASAEQLRWVPHAQQTRRELLEYARDFYEGEVYRSSSDPTLRHKTALISHRLGIVHAALGNYPASDKAFLHAIDIFTELVSRQPTAASLRADLAQSHSERGEARSSAGRHDTASVEYHSAITHWKSLSQQHPQNAAYRSDFLQTSARLADCMVRNGDFDGAVEYLQPALAATTHEGETRQPTEESDNAIASLHATYGRLLTRRYELPEAKHHLEQALHITQRIMESGGPEQNTLRHSLIGHNTGLAWVANLQGNYVEAASRFAESVRSREELSADLPDNDFMNRLLAIVYRFLSEALLATGQRADAETALERNREIIAEWAEKTSSNQHHIIELGTTYYRLGTLWHDEGRVEDARGAMTKARELLEQIARPPSQLPFPNRRLVLLLSTCPLEEFRDPSRGLELARELTADGPQDGRYWQLLGVAQYKAGHFHDAIDTLEESRQLRSGGDRFDRVFLAMSHWQLGAEETARRWLEEAGDDELGGPAMNLDFTTLDLQRFRSEAEQLINGSADQTQTPDAVN